MVPHSLDTGPNDPSRLFVGRLIDPLTLINGEPISLNREGPFTLEDLGT